MSAGIKISPRHGLNPTIPICFWCGKERSEIALLGKLPNDAKAPRGVVLDYEPCDCCRSGMAQGFTLMEATKHPNTSGQPEIQTGVYPTGRFMVITKEAASRLFGGNIGDRAFVEAAMFNRLCPSE